MKLPNLWPLSHHLGNQTSCVGKVLQGSATFTRCKVRRWKSMPVSCRKKKTNTNWMDDLTVNQLGGGKTKKACLLFKVCFWTCFFCNIVILRFITVFFMFLILNIFFCNIVILRFWMICCFIQCFYHYVFFDPPPSPWAWNSKFQHHPPRATSVHH